MLIEVKNFQRKDTAVISSWEIAKAFEVSHEEVMQDIENLECDRNLKASVFELVDFFTDEARHYRITHSGLCLLALLCPRYQNKSILEEAVMQFDIVERLLREQLIEDVKYNAMIDIVKCFNTR